MLSPTSDRLRDPDAVPYFLWDLGLTVREARRLLESGSGTERDEVLIRLLREANSRDVWLFVSWAEIDEAWPRIEHRLGRARAVWQMMRERHLEHVRAKQAR